jgi:hypothetical protein
MPPLYQSREDQGVKEPDGHQGVQTEAAIPAEDLVKQLMILLQVQREIHC